MGDPKKSGRPCAALQLRTLPLRTQPRRRGAAAKSVEALGWVPGFHTGWDARGIELGKAAIPTCTTPPSLPLLPDAHAIRCSEVKFLSRLHIESGVPGIDIAHRGGPILARSMRGRQHLLPERGVPRLRSPVLAERDEKLLIAGQPISRRRGLARERSLITIVGCGDAGHVGHVFPPSVP